MDLVLHKTLGCFRIMKQIFKSSPHYSQLSNEVFLMKGLKHSGIPQLYDVLENDDTLIVIEEYVNGESLKSLCSKEVLTERLILCYAIQICDIIRYLHSRDEKILYLDLKPDNIMIAEEKLCLVDFGSAVYKDQAEHARIFGTPGFAAPEQYVRKGKIDERADVYGIGMLLYYMTAGTSYSLGGRKNVDEIKTCSRDLKHMIASCLKKHPWQRFDSVEALEKRLVLLTKKRSVKKTYEKSEIFIAGSQERIGTTHLALLLCSYLKHSYKDVLYLEKNCRGFVQDIWRRRGIIPQDGISRCQSFYCGIEDPDQPMIQLTQTQMLSFDCIVKDLGVLSEGNIKEFLSAKLKIVVLGGKDWELDATETVLDLCAEDMSVCCAFNFLDAKRYQVVLKAAGSRRSFRIPYDPDPFSGRMDDFMAGVMEGFI